jgi:hypothetical protein
LSNALDGSLRSSWMDRMNRTHRATRRVVKDVRTIAILPWIVDNFPTVPMVLLLRHPVAVAHSLIELGWVRDPEVETADGQLAEDPEARRAYRQRTLLHEVALWSTHHGWAMSHPAVSRVHVVFYEDLVNQPNAEIDRLRHYLRTSTRCGRHGSHNLTRRRVRRRPRSGERRGPHQSGSTHGRINTTQ